MIEEPTTYTMTVAPVTVTAKPTAAAVRSALDTLAGLKDEDAALYERYSAVKAVVLAPVAAELVAVEMEFGPLQEAIKARIAEAEAQVRILALAHGESVKGEQLHAVYSSGGTTWDSAKLEGFAVAHPEVLALRKPGTPSVSIRAIKTR